ncbi:uncharacterized protein LOC111639204 [Centruroides sculpturatus]|uniref:uncharacterized protein LOC111639204 n=1 Tax=Centruroides sculpturatus TaxID=218467 RepID=UPI000C6EB653|nr:uncharacterized protein LOC111639204 [Centruroides sculpturatus]
MAKIWIIKWGNNIEINGCTVRAEDFEKPITYDMTSHPAIKNKITLNSNHDADINIYTDGSKMGNRVGSSFVAYCNDEIIDMKLYRLGEHCSNFQAELFAILKATHWSDLKYTNTLITVNTDSASAIDLLLTTNYHPIANSIQKIINNSTNHYSIKWVRGHQGNFGNENADELAKLAAHNDELEISYKNISIQTIKSMLWTDLNIKWQHEWNNCNTTTHDYIKDIPKFLKKQMV